MDIKSQYTELAAKLGDIEYKLAVMKRAKVALVAKISKLDEIAKLVHDGQKKNQKTESPTT